MTVLNPVLNSALENSLLELLEEVAPPIVGAWILATGFWNDGGLWIDSETWID